MNEVAAIMNLREVSIVSGAATEPVEDETVDLRPSLDAPAMKFTNCQHCLTEASLSMELPLVASSAAWSSQAKSGRLRRASGSNEALWSARRGEH